MKDIIYFTISILAIYVVLPILILWAKDKILGWVWAKRNPPEKIRQEREEYEKRILTPDWEFYKKHLQRAIPDEILELYTEHNIATLRDVNYSSDYKISTFCPIGQNDLDQTKKEYGLNVIPILYTDYGDPVYLKPGNNETNIMYITHHDGGDTEIFAESIMLFYSKLINIKNV